jgi:hypothetical protein
LPIEAVNVPEVAPAVTVTEEGTVRAAFALVSDMVAPPAGAALDRLAVHVVLLLEVNVPLAHARLLNTGVGLTTVTVPPVALVASPSPARDADRGSITPMYAADAFPPTVTATVARTPFAITFEFAPEAMQVYMPEPPAQSIDFAAAVAAGPGATTTFAISVAE